MAGKKELESDMTRKEELKPEKTSLKKGSSGSKPALLSVAGPPKEEAGFHVAGIGASAGGLEVFEEFFTHLPSGNG